MTDFNKAFNMIVQEISDRMADKLQDLQHSLEDYASCLKPDIERFNDLLNENQRLLEHELETGKKGKKSFKIAEFIKLPYPGKEKDGGKLTFEWPTKE